MKKTIIVAAMFCLALTTPGKLKAQAPLKVKEYGIGFWGLNSFSLQYRWGTEKKLYRLRGDISGSSNFGKSNSIQTFSNNNPDLNQDTYESKTPVDLSCGLNFSILKLKAVNEKFGILFGSIFGVNYNIKNSETTSVSKTISPGISNPIETKATSNRQSLSPFVGIALGGYYKINPSFFVYAEINPNVFYQYTMTTDTKKQMLSNGDPISVFDATSDNHSFGVSNLSNSFASITLAYRINR